MGEVYRARDTRLGRDVAIKVLPADRLSDEARRARFVQEARAASALDHPNIVTIHEIESADGIDFIVMELVAGQTLAAADPRAGAAHCRGPADRHPPRRRPGRGPRRRHRAPRPQARQRHGDTATASPRSSTSAWPSSCASDTAELGGDDGDGPGGPLSRPGAVAGPPATCRPSRRAAARRRTQRRLQLRAAALRDGDRPAGLRAAVRAPRRWPPC